MLDTDITVDTAVIGGGITGMSLARELSEKDMTVAVIEAGKVGGGTTSHSTGNLYSTVESHLGSLRSAYDTAAVRMVVEARRAAMERIEQNVLHYNIDASFKRQSWFLYSAFGKKDSKIEEELTAGQELNMPVARAGEAEIPFPVTSAVKLTGQAQINPMQYVQGLAQKLSSGRCRIYENSPVTGVHKENGRFRVATARADVKAHHVLHATHTPKGIKFIQTLLGPYREYGIACKLEKNTHPEGIFWGYFDSDSKISTRTYRQNGEEFLIVVGKPHKVGQAESNISHIKQLVEFAYRYFDVPEVIHRWGGQHYRPADHLPYIGRDKKGSEEYIATGYSTDGLVYGTMAGMLISDLIAGKKHPWSDLFDSTRSQPVKAAGKFVKENLNVAKQYLEH
ncbi:MAG: FAD-binding oxidoreductase, partial [Balneolaceae bacterium]